MLQVTMGRVEDPQIAKVFKMADRSNDLYQAWVDGGSPGTWGNVQRRYKDHAKQTQLPATPAAAPQSAGGAKRSKPGAVPGGDVASSSKTPAAAVASQRTGQSEAKTVRAAACECSYSVYYSSVICPSHLCASYITTVGSLITV